MASKAQHRLAYRITIVDRRTACDPIPLCLKLPITTKHFECTGPKDGIFSVASVASTVEPETETLRPIPRAEVHGDWTAEGCRLLPSSPGDRIVDPVADRERLDEHDRIRLSASYAWVEA
jgi:hypothetical protein